jgi:hypothetical protein
MNRFLILALALCAPRDAAAGLKHPCSHKRNLRTVAHEVSRIIFERPWPYLRYAYEDAGAPPELAASAGAAYEKAASEIAAAKARVRAIDAEIREMYLADNLAHGIALMQGQTPAARASTDALVREKLEREDESERKVLDFWPYLTSGWYDMYLPHVAKVLDVPTETCSF